MVFNSSAKICPVAALGDLKGVKVGGSLVVDIFTELLNRFFLLFIPSVAEALEKEEREDKIT